MILLIKPYKFFENTIQPQCGRLSYCKRLKKEKYSRDPPKLRKLQKSEKGAGRKVKKY